MDGDVVDGDVVDGDAVDGDAVDERSATSMEYERTAMNFLRTLDPQRLAGLIKNLQPQPKKKNKTLGAKRKRPTTGTTLGARRKSGRISRTPAHLEVCMLFLFFVCVCCSYFRNARRTFRNVHASIAVPHTTGKLPSIRHVYNRFGRASWMCMLHLVKCMVWGCSHDGQLTRKD